MIFLLTALKIFYVLDPNLQAIPPKTDREDPALEEQRKKRQEDRLLCRGHIINRLSDRLYNLYTSVTSPSVIWNSLEEKYNNEKQGTDKF